MSRSFNGSSNYLQTLSGAPVTAPPWTISLWFKGSVQAAYNFLAALDDGGATDRAYIAITGSGDTPAGRPTLFVSDDPTESNSFATAGFTDNTWINITARRGANNDQSVSHSGANTGTDTTSVTQGTPDRLTIGARGDMSGFGVGLIGHIAVWDVELSDAEVLQLATLYPTEVRPADLVAAWDCTENEDPILDSVGSNDLDVSGATFSADNPTLSFATQSRRFKLQCRKVGDTQWLDVMHANAP